MGSAPATVVVGGFTDEVAASSWSAAHVAAASAASFIAFSSSSFWKIASKRSRHSKWLGQSTAQALQVGVPAVLLHVGPMCVSFRTITRNTLSWKPRSEDESINRIDPDSVPAKIPSPRK